MDDAAARLPEADAVLGTSGGEEVVDLAVDVLGARQVLVAAELGLDQVVAVDGRGHLDFGQARRDELQHGHLGRRVLHGHAVRSQLQIRRAAHNVLSHTTQRWVFFCHLIRNALQ